MYVTFSFQTLKYTNTWNQTYHYQIKVINLRESAEKLEQEMNYNTYTAL